MPSGPRPSKGGAAPSPPESSPSEEPCDKHCVCDDFGRGFVSSTDLDKQTENHVLLEAIRELTSKAGETSAASTIAVSRERSREVPRIVVDSLTPTELRVIEYLWRHPNSVSIDSLRTNCWRDHNVTVDAVKKTVRRAEQHLIEAGILSISVNWSEAKNAVRLICADQPMSGQK